MGLGWKPSFWMPAGPQASSPECLEEPCNALRTKLLFGRLKGYRSELESALEEKKSANDPDFLDIDLNPCFESSNESMLDGLQL